MLRLSRTCWGYAQQVALGEEYDWHPKGGFVRASLPDRLYLSSLDPVLDAIGKWNVVSTKGGIHRWEIVVRGTSKLSASEVVDRLGEDFASRGKWAKTKGAPAPSSAGGSSAWSFSGRDGKPWKGTLTVQPAASDSHQLTVKLSIVRAG